MRWNNLFFDLDGTITDSAPGITNSIIYARKKWGLPCGPNSEYYRFIGPSMPQSFEDFWGFSHDDAVRFLSDYREYYAVKGLFENAVYPGVAELLDAMKNAGARLFIATTKPTHFSERIAERFDFHKYFELISGIDLNDPASNSKAAVIEYARVTCGVDMSSAVMIGDRAHDVEGAHAHGIPCIGVTWGFGGREELQNAGAEYIVDTAEELKALLLG